MGALDCLSIEPTISFGDAAPLAPSAVINVPPWPLVPPVAEALRSAARQRLSIAFHPQSPFIVVKQGWFCQ